MLPKNYLRYAFMFFVPLIITSLSVITFGYSLRMLLLLLLVTSIISLNGIITTKYFCSNVNSKMINRFQKYGTYTLIINSIFFFLFSKIFIIKLYSLSFSALIFGMLNIFVQKTYNLKYIIDPKLDQNNNFYFKVFSFAVTFWILIPSILDLNYSLVSIPQGYYIIFLIIYFIIIIPVTIYIFKKYFK